MNRLAVTALTWFRFGFSHFGGIIPESKAATEAEVMNSAAPEAYNRRARLQLGSQMKGLGWNEGQGDGKPPGMRSGGTREGSCANSRYIP